VALVSGGGLGRARRQRGDRVGARARVALQGAQAAVPALGHEEGQLHVVLGQVRERGVTELMQRPARLRDEQLRGPAV